MRGKDSTRKNEPPKLPPAQMREHDQWTVWRPVQKNGKITKLPCQADNPRQYADISNPATWCNHARAAAVAATGEASGISYILTPDGNIAAIDLDNCRDPDTGSIDPWAQQFIERAEKAGAYLEISPSGCGIHIWGLTAEGTAKVHSNTKLTINGKEVGIELFRRTSKALTVTGNRLSKGPKQLGNIDGLIDWADVFVARHKAAAEKITQKGKKTGNGLNGSSSRYGTEDILRIVREGAGDGGNRSDVFHSCVGHLYRVWGSLDRIRDEMERHPTGIADKFTDQGRLVEEIARSAKAFRPELTAHIEAWEEAQEGLKPRRTKAPRKTKEAPAEPAEEQEEAEEQLPRLFRYGDPDLKREIPWLIKGTIPEQGIGLLVGQWGSFKSFTCLDLAFAVGLADKFLDRRVKRRSGSLLLAYEGAPSLPLRTHELVRDKYNGTTRVPFVWYNRTKLPYLLQPSALEELIALARQAEDDLQQRFELPLGLIIIDTLAAAAGYSPGGGENDNAAAIVLMDVQRRLAAELNCFVLGIGHLGKNLAAASTRGAVAKDDAIDVLWLNLGERSLGSGGITNTRLKIQKCREGLEGQVHPFTPRIVTAAEPDSDGDEVTTRVIDWQPGSSATVQAPVAPVHPWEASCRQGDQQARVVRLRDALEDVLVEHGVERSNSPGRNCGARGCSGSRAGAVL